MGEKILIFLGFAAFAVLLTYIILPDFVGTKACCVLFNASIAVSAYLLF